MAKVKSPRPMTERLKWPKAKLSIAKLCLERKQRSSCGSRALPGVTGQTVIPPISHGVFKAEGVAMVAASFENGGSEAVAFTSPERASEEAAIECTAPTRTMETTLAVPVWLPSLPGALLPGSCHHGQSWSKALTAVTQAAKLLVPNCFSHFRGGAIKI